MPPVSRRQKRHEKQVRTVQNRNIAAGTALLFAVALAIWLLLAAVDSSRTNIYVSTSWVNYGDKLKRIPFAENSSKLLRDTFVDNFDIPDEEKEERAPKPHQIDGNSSFAKSIGNKSDDLLIFYLNGQLKAKDGEVVCATSAQTGSQEVSSRPLAEILENAVPSGENDASNRKRTLILLDAGQLSWTPNFPARELNDFQTALAEQVKGWEASDTYVIVSHSPNEISLTSTPLKSSLFAWAIQESLQEFEANEKVDVGQFYQNVYERVTYYSRNFSNESLQHPMLMQSGVGIVNYTNAESKKTPLFALEREAENEEEPADKEEAVKRYKIDREFQLGRSFAF